MIEDIFMPPKKETTEYFKKQGSDQKEKTVLKTNQKVQNKQVEEPANQTPIKQPISSQNKSVQKTYIKPKGEVNQKVID